MNMVHRSLIISPFVLLSFAAAATDFYVYIDNPAPVPPYTSWATAATNIQDAVDAAIDGDTIWVTNGVYQTGTRVSGRVTNRVVVTNSVTVRSVNGPEVTFICGNGPEGPPVRCVSLGGVLAGFTVTSGCATQIFSAYGGGLIGGVASNCVLVGNSAIDGGGAYGSTLINCILSGNSAAYGGGAWGSTLTNCILQGNSARNGGGAWGSHLSNCVLRDNLANGAGIEGGFGGAGWQCQLWNCTVTGNSAYWDISQGDNGVGLGGGLYESFSYNCIVYYNSPGGNDPNSGASYSCTTPLPTTGVGNFTNAPLFVDLAGGDLRLQTKSPCINAGLNADAPGPTDLDGNPRISGGTVDLGAYEFQSPASRISYAWLQFYGLPTDGSADDVDTDNDHMNNWQEWIAGTNPTNAASVLLLGAPAAGPDGVTLTWLSVTDRTYYVDRATDLAAQPMFSVLLTNIPGMAGTTTFTDTNPPVTGPAYYRVGVQP